MNCAHCANDDLVSIQLTISTEEVEFYRCPRCDTRTWAGERGELSKDRVLDLVRAGR